MYIETSVLQCGFVFHAMPIPSLLRRNYPLEHGFWDVTTHGVE